MQIDGKLKIFLLIIILVALVTGIFKGYERFLLERENRTIELAMDYSDLKKISKLDGIPLPHILKIFKNLGVKSIALPEDTLDAAEERGELSWMPGHVILSAYRITRSSNPLFSTLIKRNEISPSKYYVVLKDENILMRVSDELKLVLDEKAVQRLSDRILEVTDEEEDLAFLGIGIPSDIYMHLKKSNFRVIPRLKNSFRLTKDKISRKLNLQEIMTEDDVVIFDEEAILGYPFYITSTAKELNSRSIKFGFIEFSEQLGGRALARMMGEAIVRVHSITEEEMEITGEHAALSRWLRAVRERGVKLLYIHPYLLPLGQRLVSDTNIAYINKLKERLKKAGFKLGYVKELRKLELNLWQTLLLAFGVISAAILLLSFFFQVSVELALSLLLITLFSVLVSRYLGVMLLLRKGFALVGAIVFPVLGVIFTFSKKPLKSILTVIEVALVSLAGAIIISGLLSTTRFMLGAELFSGVKIAFIMPIFITALYFFLKSEAEEPLTFKGSIDKILNFLNVRITMLHVVLGIFLLFFISIFVLRSGNFGIPVPAIEQGVRDILEKLLIVRPRTKEFLIGYPILLLSALYYSKIKQWLWFVLALGSVAPISLINTFCHIHSPVLVSCIRSGNGLMFGIIIGLLVAAVFSLSFKFYKFLERH